MRRREQHGAEPGLRSLTADWELESAHLIGLYRAALAEHLGEPSWRDMVDELIEISPEFRTGWAEHRVAQPGGRTKLFDHPAAGLLRLRTASQWLQPRAGLRMVIYCPVDAATEHVLHRWQRSGPKPFTDWSDQARYGRCARPPLRSTG